MWILRQFVQTRQPKLLWSKRIKKGHHHSRKTRSNEITMALITKDVLELSEECAIHANRSAVFGKVISIEFFETPTVEPKIVLHLDGKAGISFYKKDLHAIIHALEKLQ